MEEQFAGQYARNQNFGLSVLIDYILELLL